MQDDLDREAEEAVHTADNLVRTQRTISDPINIRDLAIIVQALKQGKRRSK